MTIYDRGYRQADFVPEPAWRRLWPIAQHEFRGLFRGGWGVALFLLCILPSIVNLVILLIALGVLQFGGAPPGMRRMSRGMGEQIARLLPDRIEFHVDAILQTSMPAFLILVALLGSRAIAKDRASNALELYWTRGIGPRGYFLAKWFGTFLLLLLVAVVAPLLVWTTGVLVAEDWGFLQDTIGFMPRVLLGHAVLAALLAWIGITISAMAQTPNFASVLWLMLLAGSGAVAGVLTGLLDDPGWCRCVWLWQSLADFDRWLAGVPLAGGVAGNAAVALGGYLAALTLLALRRLRRQEAIA